MKFCSWIKKKLKGCKLYAVFNNFSVFQSHSNLLERDGVEYEQGDRKKFVEKNNCEEKISCEVAHCILKEVAN